MSTHVPVTALQDVFLCCKVDGVSGQCHTYNQMSVMVRNTASGLLKLGLRSHDVVTMHCHNCLEFAVLYLAILKTGAIASPVNPFYTACMYGKKSIV